jgi:hypothetical protein
MLQEQGWEHTAEDSAVGHRLVLGRVGGFSVFGSFWWSACTIAGNFEFDEIYDIPILP